MSVFMDTQLPHGIVLSHWLTPFSLPHLLDHSPCVLLTQVKRTVSSEPLDTTPLILLKNEEMVSSVTIVTARDVMVT